MDSLKGTLTPMKVLNGTLNGGIAYGTFNYNELENKPSVNGTELVGNVTIDIPTKTSDLTNDSGFITDSDVPTKTSDLTNDSGFITEEDIPTKTSELSNDSGFITSEDIPEIPTNTSQLNNDSGFLTMNTTPVRSVNSQTGDVNLFIPNATSQLNNDAGFLTDNTVPVKSVNNQTGNVELTAENIPYDSENSIAEKIDENTQAIDEKANASDVYTKAQTDTLLDAKTNKSLCQEGTFSSGTPFTVWGVGNYSTLIVIGMVQGVGSIALVVKVVNNVHTVYDMLTGSTFSSANLSFAYNSTNKYLNIISNQTNTSRVTVIKGGLT